MRRGSTNSVRYRRAMLLLASAGGDRVPVIARLVQADEDMVRDVIHRFNEVGLAPPPARGGTLVRRTAAQHRIYDAPPASALIRPGEFGAPL